MIKTNATIHAGMLQPSHSDTVHLGYELEDRFLQLCILHRRLTDTDLIPPAELDAAMLLWRQMRVRHKQGDFRNNRDELLATRIVAQWTVDVKTKLCGQKPITLVWRD